MDLAVAVVIGSAFGKIVSSLVENIITPFIGLLMGGVNFSELSATVGDTTIAYGVFLQSVFDFIIIAFAIFVAIKLLSKLQRQKEKEESKPTEPKEEVVLLREIRDNLKK